MTKLIQTLIKLTTCTALLMVVVGVATAQPSLPLGTYTTTITAADNPPHPDFIARFELTFSEGNRYRTIRNGTLLIGEGSYTSTSEQVTFTIDGGPNACLQRPEWRTGTYRWTLDGNKLTLTTVHDHCDGRIYTFTVRPLLRVGQATMVSAASFRAPVAAEAIVSAFGAFLATSTTVASTTPLPTSLAGTRVFIKDAAGTERAAPLFFVSPGQVNFQVPPGTTNGAATVTITSGDGSVSTGTVTIAAVAPGLFAANADGQGVAAAVALRVRADGSSLYEPIARYDATLNPPRFVSVPLDLGPSADTMFLILYGTGIRHRGSLAAVTASIGGTAAQVDYAGPAPDFVGLDQLNVRLPRSLIGRGEIDIALTLDGVTANTVRVNIK